MPSAFESTLFAAGLENRAIIAMFAGFLQNLSRVLSFIVFVELRKEDVFFNISAGGLILPFILCC